MDEVEVVLAEIGVVLEKSLREDTDGVVDVVLEILAQRLGEGVGLVVDVVEKAVAPAVLDERVAPEEQVEVPEFLDATLLQ